MKRAFFLPLGLCCLTLLPAGCKRPRTSVDFDRNKAYYTVNASKADAAKLGEHLKKVGYFGPKSKRAVHLDRKGDAFIISFVVDAAYKNDAHYPVAYRHLARSIKAEVFSDRAMTVLLADEDFNKRETVNPADFGTKLDSDQYEVIHADGITAEQAAAIAKLAAQQKLIANQSGGLHIGPSGDTIQIRLIVANDYKTSGGYPATHTAFLKAVRAEVFANKPVSLHLTNPAYVPHEQLQVD